MENSQLKKRWWFEQNSTSAYSQSLSKFHRKKIKINGQYITLHYITLHYITLHCMTWRDHTSLHPPLFMFQIAPALVKMSVLPRNLDHTEAQGLLAKNTGHTQEIARQGSLCWPAIWWITKGYLWCEAWRWRLKGQYGSIITWWLSQHPASKDKSIYYIWICIYIYTSQCTRKEE